MSMKRDEQTDGISSRTLFLEIVTWKRANLVFRSWLSWEIPVSHATATNIGQIIKTTVGNVYIDMQ
jgi:hypothetical protein